VLGDVQRGHLAIPRTDICRPVARAARATTFEEGDLASAAAPEALSRKGSSTSLLTGRCFVEEVKRSPVA